MFCQNCGAQLPDNAAFCNYCGSPMQQPQQQIQYQQYQQPQQQVQYQQYQQPQQYAQYQQPQQYPQYQQPAQPQKKSKLPIIIGAAAAVLVLGIVLLVSGGKDKKTGGEEDINISNPTVEADGVTDPVWEPEQTDPVETTVANETGSIPEITPAAFDFANYKVTLKQVASFTEPQQVSFSSYMPVTRETVEEKALDTLLSFDGKNLLNKAYHNYTYFGNGITAAYLFETEVPKAELVNVNTGEVYLADGAAKIEAINDRFYYVIYATEKTENQEECFIFFTDRMIALTPEEGDALYKGYARIFDAEKKQFLGDIQLDKAKTDILICKDTVCIETDYSTYDIYSADGKRIAEAMEDIYVGSEYILQETDDGCTVYDSALNKLGFIRDGKPVDNENGVYEQVSNRYLEFKNEDYQSGIMTITGKKVLDASFDYSSESWEDYLVMCNEDDTYALYLGDGTELVAGGTYKSIYKLDDLPLFRMEDQNDKDFLYTPAGKIIDITDAVESDGVFYRSTDDYKVKSYLVYSTGEWKTFTNAETLGSGLLKTDEGILDMFSGQTVIAGSYQWVFATQEYVYIYTDNAYTVYQIETVK